MISRIILIAVAVLFGSGLGVRAAPIYTSIIPGGTTKATPGSTGNYYADSFTTDATGGVSEVALALVRTGSSTNGNVAISLWSNTGPGLSSPSGNAPGTQLASFNVSAASLVQNQKTVVYWSPTVATAANTLYWVEISRSGLTTPAVSFYLNATAPSLGGSDVDGNPELYRVFASGSGTNTTAPAELQMCVSGDGSCASALAAPEPSAFSVLGIGLAGLGFALRRSRSALG